MNGSYVHGTADGYTNHGCRCTRCLDALKAQRLALIARGGREHGVSATYVYGCRCAPCRDAHVAYTTEWRRRKAAQS